MPGARCTQLDGQRWHFSHGPMDLVIGAEGTPQAVAAAHAQAWVIFQPLLSALVAELPTLRRPVMSARDAVCPLRGEVAQRMWQACAAMPTDFITPMAAVAGAVAEAVLAAYARPGITRAYVNNGGDIALWLAPGTQWRVGLVADLERHRPGPAAALDGRFIVHSSDPVRGIATSGWRGRSQSLGIADAVTVLAESAPLADAAATLIANAVNLDDARIVRAPAHEVRDDSDLGERLVTVQVPPLPDALLEHALASGARYARHLQSQGLIHAACLVCQGRSVLVQPLAGAQALAA